MDIRNLNDQLNNKNKPKRWNVNDLRDRRYEGFVNTSGVSEEKGKLFYLIEKSTGTDPFDWVVSVGEDPNAQPAWNETLQQFVNPETFGLIPNIGDTFTGAYPMTRDMAMHYMSICNEKLEAVSVDEALGYKSE